MGKETESIGQLVLIMHAPLASSFLNVLQHIFSQSLAQHVYAIDVPRDVEGLDVWLAQVWPEHQLPVLAVTDLAGASHDRALKNLSRRSMAPIRCIPSCDLAQLMGLVNRMLAGTSNEELWRYACNLTPEVIAPDTSGHL